MKTSIDFQFRFNHSSAKGSAAIIDRNSTYPFGTLRDLAVEEFGENVSIKSIGFAEQEEYDGYIHRYEIYETYVDSGSDDYSYYAIAVSCFEK